MAGHLLLGERLEIWSVAEKGKQQPLVWGSLKTKRGLFGFDQHYLHGKKHEDITLGDLMAIKGSQGEQTDGFSSGLAGCCPYLGGLHLERGRGRRRREGGDEGRRREREKSPRCHALGSARARDAGFGRFGVRALAHAHFCLRMRGKPRDHHLSWDVSRREIYSLFGVWGAQFQ